MSKWDKALTNAKPTEAGKAWQKKFYEEEATPKQRRELDKISKKIRDDAAKRQGKK